MASARGIHRDDRVQLVLVRRDPREILHDDLVRRRALLLERGPHVGDAGFDDGERCRGLGRWPRRLGADGQSGGEGAEGSTKWEGTFWAGCLFDRKVNCAGLGVHLGSPRWGGD